MEKLTLIYDDCLAALKDMEADSLDSLVTDPPAGISFMGKAWDDDKGGRDQWIAWLTKVMRECYRVLKPGAHGLVWAIPRTSHWTATALENAGFEVRDVVTHLFGSGFPKSQNISKAIDKAAGETRKSSYTPNHKNNDYGKGMGGGAWNAPSEPAKTDAAKQWSGWGTALKPASEHWILVRKPLGEKTVAKNVLKHGTGGLNIDASRVGLEGYGAGGGFKIGSGKGVAENASGIATNAKVMPPNPQGRFPANLVLSHNEDCGPIGHYICKTCDITAHISDLVNGCPSCEMTMEPVEKCSEGCAVAELDRQSLAGGMHSAGKQRTSKRTDTKTGMFGMEGGEGHRIGDSGGASRFFACFPPTRFRYQSKASKADRNAGLEGMPDIARSGGAQAALARGEEYDNVDGFNKTIKTKNHHPTVKSTKLMEYLIKMITPPEGVVLDPFMGSGSTGVAALRAGFGFCGIEMGEEYFDIAATRIVNEMEEEKQIEASVRVFISKILGHHLKTEKSLSECA